jgi:hypothetical protein
LNQLGVYKTLEMFHQAFVFLNQLLLIGHLLHSASATTLDYSTHGLYSMRAVLRHLEDTRGVGFVPQHEALYAHLITRYPGIHGVTMRFRMHLASRRS